MRLSPWPLIALGAIVSTLASSCGGNAVATDPCAGAEPVKARFTIYEVIAGERAATDTIVFGSALFSADERYDSYEWRIGTDTRVWTDSAFTLAFYADEAEEGVPIPVRFVGRRAPRTDCFPTDDGVDTAYRYLVPFSRQRTPTVGSYLGYHTDSPSDTFTVDVYWKTNSVLSIRNINRGCRDDRSPRSTISRKTIGWRLIGFDSHGEFDLTGCESPNGVLRLRDDGSLEVRYEYGTFERPRINKIFVGRRKR